MRFRVPLYCGHNKEKIVLVIISAPILCNISASILMVSIYNFLKRSFWGPKVGRKGLRVDFSGLAVRGSGGTALWLRLWSPSSQAEHFGPSCDMCDTVDGQNPA